MLDWGFGVRAVALGVGLLATCPLAVSQAHASRPSEEASKASPEGNAAPQHSTGKNPLVKKISHGQITTKSATSVTKAALTKQELLKDGKARYVTTHVASRNTGISCVPFARVASGIELKGNAANWWDAANGVYARGQAPEDGSVLNFRANGHMRLGHVAVVSRVINVREIEVDHANWAGPSANKGGVSRGISVIDVSANNDWSAVRVALGHGGDYGSVYPTYGFIYDRPDVGYAETVTMPSPGAAYEEVAEAPVRSIR